MSIWGKTFGTSVGLAFGGPLGAIVGGFLGHAMDSAIPPLLSNSDSARLQGVLFDATFLMLGYLSKADGRVSEREVAYAETVMDRMRLESGPRRMAIRSFNLGRDNGRTALRALRDFADSAKGHDELKRFLLEILIDGAMADGRMRSEGRRILASAAGTLEIDPDELADMLGGEVHAVEDTRDPYRVLGATPEDSMDDIKGKYRRLLSRHHPDKLVSQGLPPQLSELAHQRTREIRSAYEQIKGERGVR